MDSYRERRASPQERLPNLPHRSSSVSQIRPSRENLYQHSAGKSERQLVPISSERSLRRYSRDDERENVLHPHNNFFPEDQMQIQRQGFTKEINNGISYLDISNRLRDVEKKFLDLSASMDRRVQAFIEENPQKILRYMKNYEEKDTQLWKENIYKQNSLQGNLDVQREDLRRNLDDINQNLTSVIRRVDESEYRVVNMECDLQSFQNMKAAGLLPLDNKPVNKQNEILSMEVNLLKEALSQEKQKREVFFGDVMKQYQEVFTIVHKSEGQLLEKVQKQREELNEQIRRTKEQQQRLEGLKGEKLLGDNEYLRGMVKMVEAKVDEEVNKRLKHEFENKEWIEHKIGRFKDEIRSDERDLLEGEKRFAEQVHQSLGSLNTIVKNTKEQLEANIATTQTLFNENIKTINETLQVLKKDVYNRLNIVDLGQSESRQKAQDTQVQFHQHAQSINERIEKEFRRIEKVTLKFEEILHAKLEDQNKQKGDVDQQSETWKKAFEDKNYKVLMEMSNALKANRNEIHKEKKDALERIERVKEEISLVRSGNEQLTKQLEEHIKVLQTQLDFKLRESSLKSSEELKDTALEFKESLRVLSQEITTKYTAEIAQGLNTLDEKLTNAAYQEVQSARRDLTEIMQKASMQVGVDASVHKIKTDLQTLNNTKTQELNELKREINTVRQDNIAYSLKIEEQFKDTRNHNESQLKLTVEALKVYMSERLDEVRAEENEMLEYYNTKAKNELNSAMNQIKKVLSELHDQIREESRLDLEKLDSRFLKFIAEERNVRAEKDTEILKQVGSVKNMLVETIKTKIESTQALARALVNEEAAERARALEHLLLTLNTRIKAVESSLRNLITTSMEELRAQVDDRIRELEGKFEEHKTWTTKEINKLIEDFEQYVNHASVKMQLLELQLHAESQLTNENFQKVDFEIIRIDDTRSKDVAYTKSEVSRLDKQRQEDLQQTHEHFEKIHEEKRKDNERIDKKFEEVEDQRQKDMTETRGKFDAIESQRKEDMLRIDTEFKKIESNRIEDLAKMEQEIKERKEKDIIYEGTFNDVKNELSSHQGELEKHTESLKEQEQAIVDTRQALSDAFSKLGEKLKDTVKDIENHINQLDEKLSTGINELESKIQINDYIEKLYRKAKEEEEAKANEKLSSRLQKYDENFKVIEEHMTETDRLQAAFEDKTEANFKVAEEMLFAHSKCMNQLDGRLTTEELFAKVSIQNLEERVASEFASLTTQMDLAMKDAHEKTNAKVSALRKIVEEELIPAEIIRLEQAFEEGKQKIIANCEQMRDTFTLRDEEQEQKLNIHADKLQIHEQKITFAEQNVDVITDLLHKHTKRLGDGEIELEKAKQEISAAIESRFYTLSNAQKTSEKNLTDSLYTQIRDVTELINRIDRAPVKPAHMQEIRTALGIDIADSIRQTVPAMIDNQARGIIQEDVYRIIQTDVTRMIKQEVSRATDQTVPRMLDEQAQQLTSQCHKMIEDQVPNIIQRRVPPILDQKAAEIQQKHADDLYVLQQELKKQEEWARITLGSKVDKTEVAGIGQRLNLIEGRSSSESGAMGQKITTLEEKYNNLQSRIAQSSSSTSKLNEEVRSEFSRVQQNIDHIKKTQDMKDSQDKANYDKLDNLAQGMKGFQEQMQKNNSQQGNSQREVSIQLQKLFNQFDTIQAKLGGR